MLDAITLDVMSNLQKYAGKVTLSGVLIVFAMLVLLVAIITVFGKLMSGSSGNKKEVAVKTAPVVAPAPAVVASDDGDDVIAAISAAVMMMYEGTGKVPVIRSIRPAAVTGMSAWRAAGIANNTRSF